MRREDDTVVCTHTSDSILFGSLLSSLRSISWLVAFIFFFFKQKTAYEIGVRLVGSEMCIRDSLSLSNKNATAATGILFGSIFSISRVDVIEVVVLALLVLLASLLMFRQLRHYAFDYDTAVFSLKNIQLIEVAFLGLMATTVAVSAQIVGSLLIFILMILPASAAMRWGRTVWQIIGLAVLFSVAGVWSALVLSYVLNLPVSFFIAIIEAAIYFASLYKRN